MCKIVNWDHYKIARHLMVLLRGDAEEHVERMAARMARRRNPQGEEFWLGIGAALADLRRKKPRASP